MHCAPRRGYTALGVHEADVENFWFGRHRLFGVKSNHRPRVFFEHKTLMYREDAQKVLHLKKRGWTVFANRLTILAYDTTDVSRWTRLFNSVQAYKHSMGLYSSWCVDRFVFTARECFAFSRHDNVAALVIKRILARFCVRKLRSSSQFPFDVRCNIDQSRLM
jgi:hypothetical protein